MQPLIAIPAIIALLYRAYSRSSLTPTGIVVAGLTATIHAIHPWSVFFTLLGVFFLAGTYVTKVKHDIKSRLTLSAAGAAGGEGARTSVQVLANSAVASVLILAHWWQLRGWGDAAAEGCWSYGPGADVLVVGIVSNYAAVTADTFSSELGILSRSKPRLLTSLNFREVPPGTNGGVTLYGTLAGFGGGLLIGVTSALLIPFCGVDNGAKGIGLGGRTAGLDGGSGWGLREKGAWVLAVTVLGGLGSLLDSALGGWLQESVVDSRTGKVVEGIGGKKVLVQSARSSGKKDDAQSRRVESGSDLLDNNAVNFLMAFIMSLGGMGAAAAIWSNPLSVSL